VVVTFVLFLPLAAPGTDALDAVTIPLPSAEPRLPSSTTRSPLRRRSHWSRQRRRSSRVFRGRQRRDVLLRGQVADAYGNVSTSLALAKYQFARKIVDARCSGYIS
jgi:hypothetical protein